MKVHEIAPSNLGREPPIRPVSPSMLSSFQATPGSQRPTRDALRKDVSTLSPISQPAEPEDNEDSSQSNQRPQ